VTGPDYQVAIIGGGPGGITAAHLLQERGITDFVIIERGADFGGTWRDNHYPGVAVDIPTWWYQFSFAPNPNWSRFLAPGAEIHQYLCDTAQRLGLYQHLRAASKVTRQTWDETSAMWHLDIEGQQSISARFVISAVGGFVNAKTVIDIDGVDEFGGTVLRPNDWDDSYDIRGKRVAVIGTGASGVQIAAAVSDIAGSVDIYQRTPGWVLPKPDFAIPPLLRRVFGVPGFIRAVTAAGRWAVDVAMLMPMFHLFNRLPDRVLIAAMPRFDSCCRMLYHLLLRAVVDDPAIRRALVPRYGYLAKSLINSNTFLAALNRSSTSLITTPIRRIIHNGIETTDGVVHDADLIVAATGYEMWTDPETYLPATILGRSGFDLAEEYRTSGLRSYAGTCRPELPNRWEIVGPLGYVGFAWFDYVETMARHAVRLIDEARRRGAGAVSVRTDAFESWDAEMRRRGRIVRLYMSASPGLNTYLVNSQGDTVYYRPQTISGSRRFSRRSPLTDYQFTARSADNGSPTRLGVEMCSPAT
jgi:cation diffusion facilitator CzcD-associated flavoprotein CzcO